MFKIYYPVMTSHRDINILSHLGSILFAISSLWTILHGKSHTSEVHFFYFNNIQLMEKKKKPRLLCSNIWKRNTAVDCWTFQFLLQRHNSTQNVNREQLSHCGAIQGIMYKLLVWRLQLQNITLKLQLKTLLHHLFPLCLA